MTQLDDMRRAIREADPQLSRFDPLPRIICLDDFDRGMCGWTQLVGNYEDTLDAMLPGYAQHSHAMLSTLPNWDFGSHGGVDGSYALKIATATMPWAESGRITFVSTWRCVAPSISAASSSSRGIWSMKVRITTVPSETKKVA